MNFIKEELKKLFKPVGQFLERHQHRLKAMQPKDKTSLGFWYKIIAVPTVIIVVLYFGNNWLQNRPDHSTKTRILTQKTEESLLENKPKQAQKLAKQAQEEAYSIGDVSAQVKTLLLQIEAAFERGNREEAIKKLTNLNKKIEEPLHIFNTTPLAKASYKLGIGRILFKNGLIEEGVENLQEGLDLFASLDQVNQAANEASQLGANLRKQDKPTHAALVYNIVADYYLQYGFKAKAAKFYEISGDINQAYDLQTSYKLYMKAERALRLIQQRENSTQEQYNRVMYKINNLPDEATMGMYD